MPRVNDIHSYPYSLALEALVEASMVVMEFYERGFDSNLKEDGSPVTEADIASSEIIEGYLAQTDIPIVSEENDEISYEERKNWTSCWLVDPLDGTKEFIKKNGEFAINIALVNNQRAIFGAIAWPEQEKILVGGKDLGVYLVPFSAIDLPSKWQKLNPPKAQHDTIHIIGSRSVQSSVPESFIAALEETGKTVEFIQKGSALKFFDLAEGKATIYPRYAPTMEWDIAAGQAILEALNGEVKTIDSQEPLKYNKASLFNPSFIAKIGFILAFFIHFYSTAQQSLMPTNTYFRDRLYATYKGETYLSTSFLPVLESDYNLLQKNADTSLQYYDFTEWVLKKYPVQVKGKDFNFSVTPLFEINQGKNKFDPKPVKYYTNTRGIQLEGDIQDKVSFSTAFYENQARFVDYQTQYYKSIGEFFPLGGGGYFQENAVIPGAARTKPFKIGGFDYAYAIGSVVFKPIKPLTIISGNNGHFIGAGYRSLLLSDNSVPAPYIQFNVQLHPRITLICMREKLMNLMRRPIKTTDEAYYETKGFSVNYISFKATNKLAISFFEGIIWSKGDSIQSYRVNSAYYNPIPGLSEVFYHNKNQMSSLIGLNVEYLVQQKNRLYGQLAMTNSNTQYMAYQIGFRGYDLFKVKNLMVQVEYNEVPNSMYQSQNTRLNYSAYNLPLAHIKGAGFNELVMRFNYEYRRFFLDFKGILYHLENYQANALLPVQTTATKTSHQIYHQQIELGYRINRLYNFTAFIEFINRNETMDNAPKTKYIVFGIRTGLVNHYTDF